MQRRDISMGLFASAAGAALLAERAEAQTCTAPCYAQTALESAAGITPSNVAYLPGDVRRYGADPTGAHDSTAAFRSACFSTYAGWTPSTNKANVFVPAGRYVISSTVYVRSGVSIFGAGMSTFIDGSSFGAVAANVFKLGWGLISGVETQDTGGYPPELAFMFFNGGPSGGGACVDHRFPGGLIHDCWFAAVGTGVYLAGAYLYNCEFDIGLNGLIIGDGINQTVTNCRFFNQNFAITFDASVGNISDCIISGCTIEYPKFAGVQFGTAANTSTGIKFIGCDFIYNAQYSSYVNLVSIGATGSQIEFNNCTFHNWPNYAVDVAAVGCVVDFVGCIFDGLKTNPTYTQSVTAGGITFSQGLLRLQSCQFRNLPGFGVLFQGSATCTLQINGLIYSGIGQSSLISLTNTSTSSVFTANGVVGDQVTPFINPQPNVNIKIRDASDWFGPIATSGSRHFVQIPYQASSVYMVTLAANLNQFGSGSYRKSICQYVEKDNDFATSAKSFLTTSMVVQGAANLNGLMAVTVEFGAVGGGSSIASSNAGWLAVSWPSTYSFEQIDVQLIASG
jgi:hypothetical protein